MLTPELHNPSNSVQSKLHFLLVNGLVSTATITTVLFATGRSYEPGYAASFFLDSNAYQALCQLYLSIGGEIPDTGGGTGTDPSDTNSDPTTSVPESSPRLTGLALIVLSLGVVLWQSKNRVKA